LSPSLCTRTPRSGTAGGAHDEASTAATRSSDNRLSPSLCSGDAEERGQLTTEWLPRGGEETREQLWEGLQDLMKLDDGEPHRA
jgi:hypothetical protein